MHERPAQSAVPHQRNSGADSGTAKQLLRWRSPVVYLVLQAYAFLLFWPTFAAGFVSEDALWHHLTDLESTLRSFVENWGYLDYYRPLTRVSFTISSWISGEDYWGWKLMDLLIHGASSFFVCVIAARLTGKRWFGLALGLLFVTTPLGFSIPTWLSARTVGLGFFFLSLGVLLHDKAFLREGQSKVSYGLLILSCISLLFAIMSHEGSAYGMVLAGGFLFLRFLQRKIPFRALILSATALVVTAVIYYALRRYALGETMGLGLVMKNPPLSSDWWGQVLVPLTDHWKKLRHWAALGFLVPLLILNWRFGLRLFGIGLIVYVVSFGLFATNGSAPRFYYGAQLFWLMPAAGLLAVLIDRRHKPLRILGGTALLVFFAFLSFRSHMIAQEATLAAQVSEKLGHELAGPYDNDDDRILLLHPQPVTKGRGLIQLAHPEYTINQYFDSGWKLIVTSLAFGVQEPDQSLTSGRSAIVLWNQIRLRRPVDCLGFETLSPLFSKHLPLSDYLDLLEACGVQYALFDSEALTYHAVSREQWVAAVEAGNRRVYLPPENARFSHRVFRFY